MGYPRGGPLVRHRVLHATRGLTRTTRNTGAPSGATWTRLDGRAGSYASATEFYRDLLLLCANALVFFPRGSPEHSAAARTRALVAKHMSKDQPAGPSGKAAAGTAASKKAKAEADVGSLLEKTALIIVCRKRSSIAKAAAAAVTAKEEKAETDDKEEKEQKEAVGKRKAAAKDRAARGPRTNKTRGGPAVRKAAAAQHQKAAAADNGSDSNAPPEEAKKQTAADKKGSAGVAKKRNAVNFLNRMKQGGSAPCTERVSLLETLKLSAQAEQKKAGKGEGKKEPAGGSGSKKAPQERRNVGRSPKRAAAPPSPPPSKRAKGGGGGKRGGRK